jgi:pimeloyl-ACP methyl ester carboxylesterase
MSPVSGDMQPIVFDRLLGWLHLPLGRNTGVGVVLVSPLGRDGRCAYMPMRLFADQLAAAGFPTIRYDHLGTGDSSDLPDVADDALPAWLDGMEFAADVLRARAGVSRVIMGGARTGATLAAMNPRQVDGLLLLAPVLNGRSWLRRLRFSAGASNKSDLPAHEQPLDTEGLWLSASTAGSLAQVDLGELAPPQSPVFIASQNQLVGAYAAALSEAGAPVTTTDFPGFADLFLETTVNLPPLEVFERARAWLHETFEPSTTAVLREPAPKADPAVLPLPGAVERVVMFGADLRGVLCEPEHTVSDAPAVLFCNTGGDPRAGSGGFATEAARRLASLGLASLRFDFAGSGDSPMGGDEIRSHVFETPREDDADAAVDFLAERGHNDIVVLGICSGAYHALRTAWRNPKVTGVFAISPIKIVWRPGDSVTFARDEYLYALKGYAKALFNREAWKLVIQNKVDIAGLILALANRLRSRVLGWISRSVGDSPLAKAKRFAQRGGRSCLIMGINDTSLEETATYFGAEGAELKRLQNVSIEIIPELDHGLARRASREIAMNRLIGWLRPTDSSDA